ncbi:MAG: DEAD/DEAH box helicase [Accumulibacter sp.]|jgi:DEAD/DEAH box helicase domain-containing protein|uniref:DEAD/DEAH box helicase n=1 Tax=Accumulibacter sp. TaxID=2053492 RepID=UPI002FC2C31E
MSAFMDNQSRLRKLVDDLGFENRGEVSISARKPQFLDVPSNLHQIVRNELRSRLPSGMYGHQAKAIQAALDGSDVCVATPTASGKSLIFMSVSAHVLKADSNAKVLALYPARALIQDQFSKWQSLLAPMGLRCVQIDGGVAVNERAELLRNGRLVLMTPDVAHAWMMSRLHDEPIREFLSSIKIVVLDEAHVYDGVFGTNMAYFMRRLQAVTRVDRFISSTATIGDPEQFIGNLIGRRPTVFGPSDDQGPSPDKWLVMAKPGGGDPFGKSVALLKAVADAGYGRFIAFADSRRIVEQLVVIAERKESERGVVEVDNEESEPEPSEHVIEHGRILPYRAGYEDEDRTQIQRALTEGRLSGVVSTSAMELGIDIGEIDTVLMLSTPPTMKSFWQRFGRAGRKSPGYCIFIDTREVINEEGNPLEEFLKKAVEPAWLYLDNPYLQYSQALCAAQEYAEYGGAQYNRVPLRSLPEQFLQYLDNEINPVQGIPDDLYPLKQRAQSGAHYEFPIRSGIEKNFAVKLRGAPGEPRLGTLTMAQAMREGYPGAIYYYMAKPFRVVSFNYRTAEISVTRTRLWTTRADSRCMVFPKFPGGVIASRKSSIGFLVETGMQISERVTGFIEKRGRTQTPHAYDHLSPYSQKPITRYFETTGVCWLFPEKEVVSDAVALRLHEAFCVLCGIQQRDIGYGIFHCKPSPYWQSECSGMSIYDNVHGSLRLTKQLHERFPDVVELSITLALERDNSHAPLVIEALRRLKQLSSECEVNDPQESMRVSSESDDWVSVIDEDQSAVHVENSEEVRVISHRFTPQGLMYELASNRPGVRWLVKTGLVRPIPGTTKMTRVNWVTGEKASS